MRKELADVKPLEMAVKDSDTYRDRIVLHHQALRQYCRALAGSPWEGDDLVQDTWLKVWSALQKGVDEGRITRAYLYKIARNAWIDQNRKKSLSLVQQPLEELQHPNSDPMEVWMAMETLVQQLAPGQRTALLLVDVLKYTAAEAAELTKSSEGAIKAALHRARAKLRKTADGSKSEADALMTYAYLEAFRQQNTAAMVMLMNDGVPKEAVVSVLRSNNGAPQRAHRIDNATMDQGINCRAIAA
ncbi:hypothetical protein J25TS5_49750 [Paenibacillus faecis]|uniref:RNA polymerase sigma factor n=1 Tax=Paenibacillus faecis TaxID=862114 RepID=UPI001B012B6D|nr:RNA polymerase sigma factor [Paenibacillus faecis]GIO88043.1 hypothetical protein J25TS5_49750 [Paenibacillus faecis]